MPAAPQSRSHAFSLCSLTSMQKQSGPGRFLVPGLIVFGSSPNNSSCLDLETEFTVGHAAAEAEFSFRFLGGA
jgi:hypothetical protein